MYCSFVLNKVGREKQKKSVTNVRVFIPVPKRIGNYQTIAMPI